MVDGGSKSLDNVMPYHDNLQSSVEHRASLNAAVDDDINFLEGEAEIGILVVGV